MESQNAIYITSFLKFQEILAKNEIRFSKSSFNEIIKNYNFHYISKKAPLQEKEEEQINENIQKSKFVIIDHNENLNKKANEQLFIVGFENTLIILEQSTIKFLLKTLSANSKLSVCYLSNSKDILKEKADISNEEIETNSILQQEIANFRETLQLITKMKVIKRIWKYISKCISCYLIKKSYSKQNKYRLEEFIEYIEETPAPEIINNNEYIEIRNIGKGSLFTCVLIYHIKRESLYVIKKPYVQDIEISKLIERETSNYHRMLHPLIPRYYGTIKDQKYIVIEFIDGQTLDMIDLNKLTYNEKLTLIFEIMITIKYFHDNKMIYRDLKPNNIMINNKKKVIFIDFDRLIIDNNESEGEPHTIDIASDFCDPDVNLEKRFTYKSDIYSLGKMIEFIVDQKYTREYSQIKGIIHQCLNEKPCISDIITHFNSIFQNEIEIDDTKATFEVHFKDLQKIINALTNYKNKTNVLEALPLIASFFKDGNYVSQNIKKCIHYYSLAANQNDKYSQFKLGCIYFSGKYITRDINKAINYFLLAANQNHIKSQLGLGSIYISNKYIPRDINKAIHYFSLAANQNNIDAQYVLGSIYCTNQCIPRDINKTIQYFSLAANQNNINAQYSLGLIYYNSEIYNQNDINKAIHYFSLAANQNHIESLYSLGIIYLEDKYITRDINKAIRYFSLAANQNHIESQYMLGKFYYLDIYNARDINKSIHYFALAANQNHIDSQFILGFIYYTCQYIARDINKAIHYFTLASNQNHIDSQCMLGYIYYTCQYIARDINKAIHYFTLASNQNHIDSQYMLGYIYYTCQYIARDINKAIHYFTLASNQNHAGSQYELGMIYYEGKYVQQDIDKALYYISLSADKFYLNALFALGCIYFRGEYVPRDVEKGIHYFTLAANKNDKKSQFVLGLHYLSFHIKKGVYYLMLSLKNGDKHANFCYGFLLHEGKHVKRDIKEAIHHYKEASSFNINFAKNNLGILYKYGYKDIIKANSYISIEYFEEAIRQKNDYLAKYNLAHIYVYDKTVKQNIDKAIELLIDSLDKYIFFHSVVLLCLILIHKYGSNKGKIALEIPKLSIKGSFSSKIILLINIIIDFQCYDYLYEKYRTNDFLYNIEFNPVETINIEKISSELKKSKYPNAKNITSEFYKGFGNDLL